MWFTWLYGLATCSSATWFIILFSDICNIVISKVSGFIVFLFMRLTIATIISIHNCLLVIMDDIITEMHHFTVSFNVSLLSKQERSSCNGSNCM